MNRCKRWTTLLLLISAPLAAQTVSGKTSTTAASKRRSTAVRTAAAPGATSATAEDIRSLREMLTQQQQQIQELQRQLQQRDQAVQQQATEVQRAQSAASEAQSKASEAADAAKTVNTDVADLKANATTAALALQDEQRRLGSVERGMSLGGFQFSGDFRFRLDGQLRSGNAIAGPLQNVRSRYRLRLNVDKELDPRFKFHMQLSTGPLNNGLTNDQDFGSTIAKHPFSIAEAYVDFHPHRNFSLRGGRMEEVFSDSMRFLWDDDVRFNGFQQIVAIPLESTPLGIKSIEFRGGEYILTNPNVVILAADSPLVSAGFQPGKKVRDSALFHPGLVVKGDLSSNWSQQLTGDVQLYRNPNQIQLASLTTGVPILVSNGLGITLSGPLTGTGNATTTPGGAKFTARSFQIAHAAYRLQHKGFHFGEREMPFWLDFQASRNTGTSKLRDAVMASASLGAVKKFGDTRFLYQFAIKDANSLISQFTDDDLGTGTGVNIAVHAVRFDLGLTRFLAWQNLLFVQHERRPTNPAEQFFVPLQRGANATYRYLGQLAFTF